MTYLLDTHVFLWLLSRPERIRPDLLAELRDGETTLLLSAASSWEIAVKWALGRLPLPEPPAAYVPERMRRLSVVGLAVSHAHALHTSTLPAHHRDPFDRLLIAQAQLDRLTIVTVDRAFSAYDVPVVHAAAGSISDEGSELARLEAQQRRIQGQISRFRAADRLERDEVHERAVR